MRILCAINYWIESDRATSSMNEISCDDSPHVEKEAGIKMNLGTYPTTMKQFAHFASKTESMWSKPTHHLF
jgi:hypothetical protein